MALTTAAGNHQEKNERPGQLPARAFERRSKRKSSRETRRGFRGNLHGGFDGAAAAGLRKPRGSNRLWPAGRYGHVFAFALVRAFLQEEVAARFCNAEKELAFGGF